ncbi:NADH-quinone oxidoreductase subunit NuoG [Enterobacteriaceae endosymbiont of Donacia tomentosa]|uniref:NADH-quinone oxidoreductase subunit NuoG n=1 Tax=Enterobacteriaceae endosymbiont of Donacia tomentosa TaxID=2675787 RepID=UPI00144A12C1|nr:NADH-quinone oxidoreductase subunit NuoG [Enterobacteriaceae endosymbiont of Donacia tomentosa]QJC31796.1 NADH-quinone oxidoreductase subunit NuoG [Enterobacteriaceae endosymbiont of Donacia tomentosa]
MIHINIEGQSYKVNRKDNLLKICLSLGFNIPYFCWHPILGSIGSCRQCAIKQYDNIQKKNGFIIMSCMSLPIEETYISINDKEVINFRRNIIELLMLNHPHDCPICDEGGSCHLQDMTVMTGHYKRRYNFPKRKYKNQYLGPFISHVMNRCITCYRCVRYYKDYADGKDFNVFGSKNNIYFGRYSDGLLENKFSGNLIEICPTGVFNDKTYIEHFTRKWDLQYAPSICQHCSLGCNIFIGERYGNLSCVQNRFHEEINHYFLCDKGRFGYGYINLKKKPIQIIQKKNKKKVFLKNDQAIKNISDLILKSKKIIGIGSARASIESNFILKQLVGDENFCVGILEDEKKQIDYIIKIIQHKNIYTPSLSEIEDYDVILILGEDVSTTNPRVDLAIRQAIKKNTEIINKKEIPYWHANAIFNLKGKSFNSLFITSINKTSLNDISSWSYYTTIDNQVNFAFALSYYIDNKTINPLIKKDIQNKIVKITEVLLNARKPLIISGTSLGSLDLIMASYAIVHSLNKKRKNTGLFYVLNTVNSMGIGLINGKTLNNILNKSNNIDTIIIMENDLYYYEERDKLDVFFKSIPNIIVIDHVFSPTTQKAHIVLPATNFMESSGTVINNECRAQRFFQASNPFYYNKKNQRKSSWKWIYSIYAKINNLKEKINLDNLIEECEKKIPILNGISNAAPKANYRVYNRKFARSPIRYSGRTSILANINIHEPKQPEDKDTIFNFSMEGNYNSDINCTHLPFLWAPGWNSLQALNKFQKEIGVSSKYNAIGFKIKKKHNNNINIKKNNVFKKFKISDKLLIVPCYNFFNSNSLVQKSSLIKEYFSNYYAFLNNKDAMKLGILNNCLIKIYCLNNIIQLKTFISTSLHQGLIGVPLGTPGIPLSFLGKTIEKLKVLK